MGDLPIAELNVHRRVAVISQPMYFPWVGLLEQVRLSDVFVHLDDAQFARGFFNRVQIKVGDRQTWMTIPLKRHHQRDPISQIRVDDSTDWRAQHRSQLVNAYRGAPFLDDVLRIVDDVYALKTDSLADISVASVEALVGYFGLADRRVFVRSSHLECGGRSTQRLLAICQKMGANVYITGEGALRYLNHSLLEDHGVSVYYMNYEMRQYPQRGSTFTPFVSSLDLVANCGIDGAKYISSNEKYWQDYLRERG